MFHFAISWTLTWPSSAPRAIMTNRLTASYAWTLSSWMICVSSFSYLSLRIRHRNVPFVSFYACSFCPCDVDGGQSCYRCFPQFCFVKLKVWRHSHTRLPNYSPLLEEGAHRDSELSLFRLDRPL